MLLKIPLDTSLYPQTSKHLLLVRSLGLHLKAWTCLLHLGFVDTLLNQCCIVKFGYFFVQFKKCGHVIS